MTFRLPRVMRTLAGITAGLFVLTSALTAQPPKPATPATAEPTLTPDELKLKQEENKKNFAQFKEALFRLATRLEKSERPEMKDQAKVIRQALDEVEKKGVDGQFAQLVAGIAKGTSAIDYSKLEESDKQLVATLQAIMALLETESDSARLKAEREKIEALMKELKGLIDNQKSNQARTESMKGDKDKLKKEQDRLKDTAKDLADRMGGKDGKDGAGGAKKDDRAEGKAEPKGGEKAGDGKGDTAEAKGEGKEAKGEGKEGKEGKDGAGEGKGEGKGKDGKEGEGKGSDKEGKEGAGEGKGEGKGDGKEGKEGDGKGKPSDGKGDGKEGSGKPGDGAKPGDGGAKPSDGKPGDGAKPGDGKGMGEGKGEGKPSDGGGKPGEGAGKPSEGKGQGEGKGGGKPSEGKGQGGEGKGSGKEGGMPPQGGQPGGGKPGGGQPGGGQPPPPGGEQKNEAPGRKEIQEAVPHQGDASKKIEDDKRADAGKAQDKAIDALEKAMKKLEDRLKQLREEEIKKLLANVEARCQKMLAMQIDVYENTKGIDAARIKNGGEMTNVERQKSGQQSDKEGEIVAEAERCMKLLESEGSAVAFAKVLEEVRQDMIAIQRRLNSSVVDKDTQSIEENVIAMLKEMVEALKKQQQEMSKDPPKPGQPGQQKPPNQKLINLIAELKLIRSLQSQVNMRTKMYGDKEKAEQSKDANVQLELRQLSARQAKLQEMIDKIASGENEK